MHIVYDDVKIFILYNTMHIVYDDVKIFILYNTMHIIYLKLSIKLNIELWLKIHNLSFDLSS